jgi:CubicO group peptidase (beta-lactamase class C family)
VAVSTGGFAKARLETMHDILAGYVDHAELPGLVWLVSRRGETHVDAVGTKAVGGREPMARDTIFRISSMTKPVTAVAALILVEECTIRLDDPVDALLPELANRQVLKSLASPLDDTVPANRPITLRDLLTFRLGYGIVAEPPGLYPVQDALNELTLGQGPPGLVSPPDPDEWIRRLGTLPLMHQPGEKWMYNTGSDVLGVLIARAAGQPLDRFMRERIFDPLGMRDTGFFVPAAGVDRLATSYATDPDTGALALHDEPGGEWSRPPAFPSGAGGLVSTVDDFLAFSLMLANFGSYDGARIVSRPSIETMTTDQLTPEQKAVSGLVPEWFDSHGWGFGVGVVTRRIDPTEPVGQYGWDGGMGTVWRVDPREEMITMLMTQKAWTSPKVPEVARDFWTSAYAAIDD